MVVDGVLVHERGSEADADMEDGELEEEAGDEPSVETSSDGEGGEFAAEEPVELS